MGQDQGTFGIQAGQAALNVGSGIVGTAAGYLFAGMNDRRQIRQQTKLNKLAMDSNKELANYNYDLEMKKWNDTNYSAQMQQLEKAGLNPALLYGMSGGGGQTAQTKGAEGVSTAQAPQGGGEIMAMQQYALQNRMTDAQIKLAESQAHKNEVEANKTEGVDTEEAKTRIANLTQGIQNQKAQEALTKAATTGQQLENNLASATLETNIATAETELRKLNTEADIAVQEWGLTKETWDTKIKQIKADYTQTLLTQALTRAQTEATNTAKKLNEEQIKKVAADIAQGWAGLNISQQKVAIDKFNSVINNAYAGMDTFLHSKNKYYESARKVFNAINGEHTEWK